VTGTIWVVGGEQRVQFYKPREWAQFRKALVLRVDEDATAGMGAVFSIHQT
jgi:hypothetical protein